MTHRKKLTIFLLAIATLFTFVLLIHPYQKNDSSLLSDKLLRFRVLADSDSSIDQYEKMGLENPFIIIDTNHDNSGKQYLEQVRIVRQTLINRDWNEKIKKVVRGFMIESYLEDGRQNEPEVFGKSITDPCLGWDNTAQLVHEIYDTLGK